MSMQRLFQQLGTVLLLLGVIVLWAVGAAQDFLGDDAEVDDDDRRARRRN